MRLLLTLPILLLTSVAVAQTPDLTISVDAPKIAGKNVPVTIQFAKPLPGPVAEVLGADGKVLLSQFSPKGSLHHAGPELSVLLPQYKEAVKLTVKFGTPTAKAAFTTQTTKEGFPEIRREDKPVLRFMNAKLDETSKDTRFQTYKVFHHLFDASGKVLLTNGAEGKFPHHRGLFFGFNRISYTEDGKAKQADIWHCSKGEFQSYDETILSETGPLFARQQLAIGWHGQDKAVFANETRELTAWNVPGGIFIDFSTRVTTPLEKVRLDGDPQHAGFHFRASQDVEKSHTPETYFLRVDGKGKPGTEINWDPKTKKGPVNLPWNAMSFVVGGKRYTAVYLDHPDNPKEARYSERTYGRFGSYFEYDLSKSKPLNLRYRLWVQEGEMTVEECQALSAAFVAPAIMK